MIIIGGNKRDFFDHKSHKINIFVIKISFLVYMCFIMKTRVVMFNIYMLEVSDNAHKTKQFI